jgi:hypothetical protein
MEDVMRKRGIIFVLAGLVISLVFVGCNNEVTAPQSEELAAIRQMIEKDLLFTSDGSALNDGGAVSFSGGMLGKTATPIYPAGWGRRVTSTSRTIEFDDVNDTVVVATITHTIVGEVKIAAKYSLSDTVITIVTKPFTEETIRKAKFYRVARTNNPRFNWRPREISAAKGGTLNSQVVINEIQVTIGNDSFTITDPTEYFLKLGHFGGREVPSPRSSQPMTIRVTITSTESDTDFVSLHRPAMMIGQLRPGHLRMPLVQQSQTGNTYQRVYELSWNAHFPGRHHVFVTALTRSSIFDDVANFSSKVWGVPYIVE